MVIKTAGVKPNGDYYFLVQWDDNDNTKILVFECGPKAAGESNTTAKARYKKELQRLCDIRLSAEPTLTALPFTLD